MRVSRAKLVSAAATILAALGVTLAVVLSTGGKSVTINLGGPHGTPDVAVSVPREAVEDAADALEDHAGARSENPVGVSAVQLDRGQEQREALAQRDPLPVVAPLAAPEQRGCVTRYVSNFSSRGGVRPLIAVVHYTVSPNVAGTADVNSIAAYFDRSSSQASSNYVIDSEGNCLYIVREADKAWTQAAFNPVSVSIEVINTGREPVLSGSAGMAKIAMVLYDVSKRWGLPIQLGAVSGCTVTRRGIVDHQMLGACGGGHHDIAPYSVAAVIRAVKAFAVTQEAPRLVIPPATAANAVCTVYNLESRLGIKPPDWTVDAKTRGAIKVLQRRFGIPQTGYAGVLVGRILRLKWCRV